jgi:hypothetical protein
MRFVVPERAPSGSMEDLIVKILSDVVYSWNTLRARSGRHYRFQADLEHRREFEAFYHSLPVKENPVYIFLRASSCTG